MEEIYFYIILLVLALLYYDLKKKNSNPIIRPYQSKNKEILKKYHLLKFIYPKSLSIFFLIVMPFIYYNYPYEPNLMLIIIGLNIWLPATLIIHAYYYSILTRQATKEVYGDNISTNSIQCCHLSSSSKG